MSTSASLITYLDEVIDWLSNVNNDVTQPLINPKEPHPNYFVTLDGLREDEMVENQLLMTDDFLEFLSQTRAGAAAGKTESSQHSSMVSTNYTHRTVEAVDSSPKINIINNVVLPPNDCNTRNAKSPRINIINNVLLPPKNNRSEMSEAGISQSYDTIQEDHPPSQVESSLNDYGQVASPTLETNWNGTSQMVHPPATQPTYLPSAALVSPAQYNRNKMVRKQSEGVEQVKLSPEGYANHIYEAAAMRQAVPSMGYNRNQIRQQTMPLTQVNGGIFIPKDCPTTVQQVKLSPNDNTNQTYKTAVIRQMVPPSEYNQSQTPQQTMPRADMSQSYGTIQKDHRPSQVQTSLNDYGQVASSTLETNLIGISHMVHPPATQPKYYPSAALVYPAHYIQNQMVRKQTENVVQVMLSPEASANQTYKTAAMRQTVPSIGYNRNQLRQTMPLTQMNGGIFGPKVSPITVQQVRFSPNDDTNQTHETAVMRQMVPRSECNQRQTRQQTMPEADISQSYDTIQKDHPHSQVQSWLSDYGQVASPTLETNLNGRSQMVHPPATQPKYSPSAALLSPTQYIRNQMVRKQSEGVVQVKLSPEGYANQIYEAAAMRQAVPSSGYNRNQIQQQTISLTQTNGGILGPKVSHPTLQQVRLSSNGGNTNQAYGTEQKVIYSATDSSTQAPVRNTNRMMPYSVAIRRQAKLPVGTEHPRMTSMPRNDMTSPTFGPTNYSHQISTPETSAETFESTPGLNETTMNNVKRRRRVTKPELRNPNPMSSFPAGNLAMVSGHRQYHFAVPNRKHTTSVYQQRVGTNYPGMNQNHVVQYMDGPVNGSNYMGAQTGQRYYPANNYNQNGYYCMPNLGNPHRPATVRTPGYMSCMGSDQQAEIRPASTL